MTKRPEAKALAGALFRQRVKESVKRLKRQEDEDRAFRTRFHADEEEEASKERG